MSKEYLELKKQVSELVIKLDALKEQVYQKPWKESLRITISDTRNELYQKLTMTGQDPCQFKKYLVREQYEKLFNNLIHYEN